MNTTLILIPVAGLGLAATLALGGPPGDPCKQQCTGVAAGAVKTEPAPEPSSVAERSLVRFLGDGQAVAAPLAPATTEHAAQAGCSTPAAGACQAAPASVATSLTPAVARPPTVARPIGQAGYGTAAAGATQARAAQADVDQSAERAARAAEALAAEHEAEARRYAEAAVAQEHYASSQARQAANEALYAEKEARLRTKEVELAAGQYAKVAPRSYPEAQAAQGRAAPDDYTRSLERRIEALEKRLLEREHAEMTPPPSVYYTTPGSGAKIMRAPRPSSGGTVGTWPSPGGSVGVWSEGETPEPVDMIELEELEELEGVPGVLVVPPREPRAPAAVAVPRAPRGVGAPLSVPSAPQARLAPEPEMRAFSMLGGGRGAASGPAGSDLSELTRLIEEMREQVADLQRDLEALRDDLHNVRTNRSIGVR